MYFWPVEVLHLPLCGSIAIFRSLTLCSNQIFDPHDIIQLKEVRCQGYENFKLNLKKIEASFGTRCNEM